MKWPDWPRPEFTGESKGVSKTWLNGLVNVAESQIAIVGSVRRIERFLEQKVLESSGEDDGFVASMLQTKSNVS